MTRVDGDPAFGRMTKPAQTAAETTDSRKVAKVRTQKRRFGSRTLSTLTEKVVFWGDGNPTHTRVTLLEIPVTENREIPLLTAWDSRTVPMSQNYVRQDDTW